MNSVMQRSQDKEKGTREGRLFSNRALLLLILPIIAEQFLNALMGMVDSMMVSNVGSAALSGVSLVDSVNNLVIQAFNALATGAVIICSTYIGQKDIENVGQDGDVHGQPCFRLCPEDGASRRR